MTRGKSKMADPMIRHRERWRRRKARGKTFPRRCLWLWNLCDSFCNGLIWGFGVGFFCWVWILSELGLLLKWGLGVRVTCYWGKKRVLKSLLINWKDKLGGKKILMINSVSKADHAWDNFNYINGRKVWIISLKWKKSTCCVWIMMI